MSNPVTTKEIGPQICDALGLPMNQVSAIDLRFRAGQIVHAIVEFVPERDQLDQVLSVVKRYQLLEKSAEDVPVHG